MKTTFIAAIALFTISATAQKRIQISELPEPARIFLDIHYKGIAIEKTKKDAEYGEKGYEVILVDGTEIEFWKDGSYREIDGKGKAIPTAYIDPKVTAYVDANFPNNKITHIDYGHKNLDVDLTGKIDLEFTKEGKILKGKKE